MCARVHKGTTHSRRKGKNNPKTQRPLNGSAKGGVHVHGARTRSSHEEGRGASVRRGAGEPCRRHTKCERPGTRPACWVMPFAETPRTGKSAQAESRSARRAVWATAQSRGSFGKRGCAYLWPRYLRPVYTVCHLPTRALRMLMPVKILVIIAHCELSKPYDL